MEVLRAIGSLAFVVGLFVAVFVGAPWYVYHDPILPWWLKVAVYSLLGGILLVLLTLAAGRRKGLPREGERREGDSRSLLLVNSADIPGREVDRVLGLVQGHTIYAIWLGKDLSALARLILGGELVEYTDMMGLARKVALDRMLAEARALEADAVINLRFTTTSVIGSAAELLAYGTAVKLRDAAS